MARKPPSQVESLFDANGVMPGGRRRIGRVERRTAAAIRAAKAQGQIDALEDPLAAAALTLAESMDRSARTKPDPYAVVASSRELREVLAALGLTTSTDGPDDALLEELRKLGEPATE